MDPGRHTQYKFTPYMAASLIFFSLLSWMVRTGYNRFMTLVPGLERPRPFPTFIGYSLGDGRSRLKG